TTAFSGTTIEFSADGTTGWAARNTFTNATAQNVKYIRVTPTTNNVQLLFLPFIGTPTTSTVKAQSVAGQILVNSFSAGGSGIFPFSPIAHAYGTTAAAVLANDPTGNFGFTV